MQQSSNYRQQSRDFLAKAYLELDEDLAQASEKAWGAAAEMVKALAEERGWAHQSHSSLRSVASRLRRETGDDDFWRIFAVAGELHTNFYESWFEREDVALGIRDVERFVDKVESLLAPTE